MINILFGLIYLIYSVVCRDKFTYHSRRYIRKSEITIIKLSGFLRLQLKFSIFNSIYLIIYGILITVFNLNNQFIVMAFLPFHFINFLLLIESKSKGYVDYKALSFY